MSEDTNAEQAQDVERLDEQLLDPGRTLTRPSCWGRMACSRCRYQRVLNRALDAELAEHLGC